METNKFWNVQTEQEFREMTEGYSREEKFELLGAVFPHVCTELKNKYLAGYLTFEDLKFVEGFHVQYENETFA